MDTGKEKRIWVRYQKNPEDLEEEFDLKEVVVKDGMTSKVLKKHLLDAFNITKQDIVVKLRNFRESLVPINSLLAQNSPSWPYTLEVCQLYSQVKPRPRTVSLPTYQNVLRRRLQNIEYRLSKLEETLPELPEIQGNKLKQDCTDLESKMDFLISRIKEAEDFQWKGMFQRNPLW
eukprot:gene7421-8241_t